MGGIDRVAGQQPFLRPGRRGDGYVFVSVATTAGQEPGLLTCHAVNAAHPPAFEVVEAIETGSPM